MGEGGFESAGEKPCFYFVSGGGGRSGESKDADSFLGSSTSGPFIHPQGVTSVVLFYQVFGMHVFFWFPRVVG